MPSISKEELEQFVGLHNDFFSLKASSQIDCFVYFLTIEKNLSGTQATAIRDCFITLNLTPYSNISQYLTDNLKGTPPKFIRIQNSYQLHRSTKESIDGMLNRNPIKKQAAVGLQALLTHVSNPTENEFLREAIDCFEIKAYRASVIMVWNLTVDHLFEYIMKHELANFNLILSGNTDKRIKVTQILVKDDFNEIPEGKFIEFCRTAGIISNDIRKILDTKLGIRNTYAHHVKREDA